MIYAWQVYEDGEWGTIGAIIRGVSTDPVPLIFRDRDLVERVRPVAEQHHDSTGLPVRLAEFTLTNTLETIGWPERQS